MSIENQIGAAKQHANIPQIWKLNVQGVLIEVPTQNIVVKDAMSMAGIDPDTGWIAILKVAGQPKQQVQLSDEIDLSTPGIEKLRLTPAEINNGEAPSNLLKQFSILDKDEEFLLKRELVWETVVEAGRRWMLIRNFQLPKG